LPYKVVAGPGGLEPPTQGLGQPSTSGAWPRQLYALRMGREEEQDLMGRSDGGLREDRGICRASNENVRPQPLPRCLRSRFRPVLPRLQSEAVT